MDNFDSIYKYIDKKGIPYSSLSVTTLTYKPNIYKEKYLGDEISHNLKAPNRRVKIELPFDLSQSQMQTIVTNYIFDTTGVKLENASQILSNPTIHGNPFLLQLNEHGGQKKVCLAKKTIPGSLILRDTKGNCGLTTLGTIERIQGFLGISDAPLVDLGRLERVYKDMWITSTDTQLKLRTLSPIKIIGGNLSIRGNAIESLGTLEEVRGNVSLRKSSVKDLGNLKFVGGNLLVAKENKKYMDFSGTEVNGKIIKYNDKW